MGEDAQTDYERVWFFGGVNGNPKSKQTVGTSIHHAALQAAGRNVGKMGGKGKAVLAFFELRFEITFEPLHFLF